MRLCTWHTEHCSVLILCQYLCLQSYYSAEQVHVQQPDGGPHSTGECAEGQAAGQSIPPSLGVAALYM